MMIGNLRGRARAWRSWLFALGLASVAFLFWLIIGGGSGSIAVAADGAAPTGADRYLTTSQLEAALDASPWPPRLHDEVTRLAICESGLWGLSTVWLDTRAERITAREHSLGVLQLNVRARPWLDALDLFDVRQNLIAGYTIWLERGGRSWDEGRVHTPERPPPVQAPYFGTPASRRPVTCPPCDTARGRSQNR